MRVKKKSCSKVNEKEFTHGTADIDTRHEEYKKMKSNINKSIFKRSKRRKLWISSLPFFVFFSSPYPQHSQCWYRRRIASASWLSSSCLAAPPGVWRQHRGDLYGWCPRRIEPAQVHTLSYIRNEKQSQKGIISEVMWQRGEKVKEREKEF